MQRFLQPLHSHFVSLSKPISFTKPMAGFPYVKSHPNDFHLRKDCQYQISPKLNSHVIGSEGCKELLHFPSLYFQQRITTDHKIRSVFCRMYKHPTLNSNPCACSDDHYGTWAEVLSTPFHFANCSCWMYSLCIWKPLRKLWYLETAGRSVRMSRRVVERPLVGVNMQVAIS